MSSKARPAKRSSPNAVGSPAVKRGRTPGDSEITRKYKSIIDVLQSHEETPAPLRYILCDAVEHSLIVPKDERHEFQNVYVQQIGQILESVQLPLEEELSKYQEFVENSDARRADLEAKEREAEKTLNKLRFKAGQSEVSEKAIADAKAVEEPANAVAISQAKKDAIAADISKVEATKADLEAILIQQLYPMKVLPIGRNASNRFIEVLKERAFDSGLLSSLRAVVQIEPKSRSTWEKHVMTLVEGEFDKKIAAVKQELAELEQKKSEQERELEAQKAELATAEAKAASSDAELTKVFDAITEAEADVLVKKKDLSKYWPDLRKAANKFDNAKAALASFMSGPMQDYCDLKDLAPSSLEESEKPEELFQAPEAQQVQQPESEKGPPVVTFIMKTLPEDVA